MNPYDRELNGNSNVGLGMVPQKRQDIDGITATRLALEKKIENLEKLLLEAKNRQHMSDLNYAALELQNKNMEKAENRYFIVRRLNVAQFAELYRKNIETGEPFDSLVDKIITS